MNISDLLFQISPLAETVLILLLILSALSWGVIVLKLVMLARVHKENQAFLAAFEKTEWQSGLYENSRDFPESPLAKMFNAVYEKVKKMPETNDHLEGSPPELGAIQRALVQSQRMEVIQNTLLQSQNSAMAKLSAKLPLLATTAGVSPFIGLFGTVWGIVHAFMEISHQSSASIAAVAPGIAEALITTAVGLFAAIPAVIGYNYFIQRIRSMDSLANYFRIEIKNLLLEGKWKG